MMRPRQRGDGRRRDTGYVDPQPWDSAEIACAAVVGNLPRGKMTTTFPLRQG